MNDIILMLPHLNYLDALETVLLRCVNPKISVEAICEYSGCRIEVNVYDMEEDFVVRDYLIAKSVAISPNYFNWEHVKEQSNNLYQILAKLYISIMSELIIENRL